MAVTVILGLLGARSTDLQAQAPITDSNYRIDLHQGPVLGSTRVIGLAGAYAAIAEGAVGLPSNPAAVAHREHYSKKWFDYDLSFDYLTPGTFQTRAFDMDGNRRALPTSFHMFNLGALLQFGAFGIGVHYHQQISNFEDQSVTPQAFQARLAQLHFTLGYTLLDHQLVIGAGASVASFDVNHTQVDGTDGSQDEKDSFSTYVPGVEVGLLIRPKSIPVRFAAAARFAFQPQVSTDCGADCPVGFYLPEGAAVPWQVRIGVTYRWGKRQFNKPFRVQKRRRPRRRSAPRRAASPKPPPPTTPPAKGKALAPPPPPPPPPHPAPKGPVNTQKSAHGSPKATQAKAPKPEGEHFFLVSAELVMIGKVKNAVGTDGFLDQIQERAGRHISVSARLGVEAEVWKRRLRLRAGTYWEPSRFDGIAGRIHGTVGFAFRLFDFKLWGARSLAISAAFDGAYQYTNLSLSVGFWH